jgi:hypothetical protein
MIHSKFSNHHDDLQGIVKHGTVQDLRLALKKKPNAVVIICDKCTSLLSNACWWGRFDMALALVLEHGHPVDLADPKHGHTALHNACNWGRIEAALFLIHRLGANPRAVSKDGLNALHCASSHGHTQLARILVLDFGLDVHAGSHTGDAALHLASRGGYTHTALSLLELGARVDAFNHQGGTTPLMQTAAMGFTDTVLALIHIGGARTDLLGRKAQTLLHVACAFGNAVTVSALLAEGACLDAQNSDGQKPQDVICLFPDARPEDKPLVLAAIARHLRLQRRGREVLRLAAGWDHASLAQAVRALVAAAAEPWACSVAVAQALQKHWTAPRHPLDMFRDPATGRTALAVAAAAGIFRNAELLVQAAASPLELDCGGRTPWQLARARGSECMSVWFESMPVVYWAGHSQLRYRAAATSFLLCCRFSRMRAPVQPVEEGKWLGPGEGFIPGVTFMHPDDWCIPPRDAYRILHFLGPDELSGGVWPGLSGGACRRPRMAAVRKRRVPPRRAACAQCAKTAGKLMECTRCRAAHYCSKKCQKLHYPEHKAGCRAAGSKLASSS